MNVEQWVEVLRAAGLDEATMQRWHREFEQRYPADHQTFLAWLALSPARIDAIRQDARKH